jgi:hypothetical protein
LRVVHDAVHRSRSPGAILLDEPKWAEYLEIVEADLAELVQPN